MWQHASSASVLVCASCVTLTPAGTPVCAVAGTARGGVVGRRGGWGRLLTPPTQASSPPSLPPPCGSNTTRLDVAGEPEAAEGWGVGGRDPLACLWDVRRPTAGATNPHAIKTAKRKVTFFAAAWLRRLLSGRQPPAEPGRDRAAVAACRGGARLLGGAPEGTDGAGAGPRRRPKAAAPAEARDAPARWVIQVRPHGLAAAATRSVVLAARPAALFRRLPPFTPPFLRNLPPKATAAGRRRKRTIAVSSAGACS